jgi:hypothetical protein
VSALRRNPQPNGNHVWLERIKQIVIRSGVQEQLQIGGWARLRGHKQQRPMLDLPLSQAAAQLKSIRFTQAPGCDDYGKIFNGKIILRDRGSSDQYGLEARAVHRAR